MHYEPCRLHAGLCPWMHLFFAWLLMRSQRGLSPLLPHSNNKVKHVSTLYSALHTVSWDGDPFPGWRSCQRPECHRRLRHRDPEGHRIRRWVPWRPLCLCLCFLFCFCMLCFLLVFVPVQMSPSSSVCMSKKQSVAMKVSSVSENMQTCLSWGQSFCHSFINYSVNTSCYMC